jgi:uncharacterized protein YjbI with pentapeptide repeats
MANEKHVALLKQGVEVWNKWREEKPDIVPDLYRATLTDATLTGANLHGAYLERATLTRATLTGATLTHATLTDATLTGAILHDAILTGANLAGADLNGAILTGATLHDADLSRAFLAETVFGNTDLTTTKGLETSLYMGPSTIDHRTLQRSGPLPLAFLRGVGLPDNLIDYLPSLLNQPIQFFSCFISYSSKDQKFADRLHADLQNKGVRCWFAPHDMPIGAKTWDAIDEAIRLRDKVLLILSKNAIESDWIEDEVTKAFAEERTQKQLVLFPILSGSIPPASCSVSLSMPPISRTPTAPGIC